MIISSALGSIALNIWNRKIIWRYFKMKTVRLALIGAGTFACCRHYSVLNDFEDVKLEALCDLDSQKLSIASKRFGIPKTFLNYKKMLKEVKPDAIYAILPPHYIFDVAMDVIQQGIPLFIEKPPGITTFQAKNMAEAAEQNGVLTGVGFQRRYHPLAQECWKKAKMHGEIQQIYASYYKSITPQEKYPYYRGAIDFLRCDAIHAIDALRFYAGLSEIESVQVDVRKTDVWDIDGVNALVRFKNGISGVLLINWRAGKRFLKFEFHSKNSSAFVDTDGEAKVWTDNADAPIFSSTCSEFSSSDDFNLTNGIIAEDRAFINAVKSGKTLHNTITDAVKTMELVDYIYLKAQLPLS
jgi:virulence factor